MTIFGYTFLKTTYLKNCRIGNLEMGLDKEKYIVFGHLIYLQDSTVTNLIIKAKVKKSGDCCYYNNISIFL